MNTEQVIEMIDAITEGRPYALSNGETMSVAFQDDIVTFFARVGGSSIDNPRTAREIAGALVAWANHKDGSETRYVLNPKLNLTTDEIQLEFEALHRILAKTSDIPRNKEKLIELQRRIQVLRENGAKDFESDV